MPQIVEHLLGKIVTQVVCGLDYGFALGQDFHESETINDESKNEYDRVQSHPEQFI